MFVHFFQPYDRKCVFALNIIYIIKKDEFSY